MAQWHANFKIDMVWLCSKFPKIFDNFIFIVALFPFHGPWIGFMNPPYTFSIMKMFNLGGNLSWNFPKFQLKFFESCCNFHYFFQALFFMYNLNTVEPPRSRPPRYEHLPQPGGHFCLNPEFSCIFTIFTLKESLLGCNAKRISYRVQFVWKVDITNWFLW